MTTPARDRAAIALAAAFALGCARAAHARQDAAPAPEASARQERLALNGELELARLVDVCAKRLGFDVEYDAAALKGGVTIRVSEELGDAELWALTNELLAARGFASVQRPGARVLSIVKAPDAPASARLERPGEADERAGFATLVVKAEHRDAKEIVEAIKQVLSKPSGGATLLGDKGYVLVTDYRARIEQALYVKSLVDVPNAAVAVETVPVANLRPTELIALATAAAAAREDAGARKLRGKLIAAPDGSGIVVTAPVDDVAAWREILAAFDRRPDLETRSYSPRTFPVADVGQLVQQVGKDSGPHGAGDRWKLVTDELTGTLILTATPGEHEAIAALVARLDAMPGAGTRQVRTYVIRNRPVKDVAAIVSDLVDAVPPEDINAPQAGAEPSRQSSASGGASTPTAAAAQSTERTILPPGGSTSVLTTQATGQAQGQAPSTGMSQQPGARGAQPRSTTTAGRSATITTDEGTNLLIVVAEPRIHRQVESLLARLDVRQPQVMLEVLVISLTDDEAMDLGVELSSIQVSGSTLVALSSLFGLGLGLPGGSTAPPTPGQGFTGAVLRPGDFGVLVKALETLNKGRTLHRPKVLINTGESATLTSVLQEPVLSTNASTTVATTSFGGTQDAGTTVTVKPQIAEGDHLILDYSVSISSFVGDSTNPSLPPPRQQNALQSVVTIPDGFTVAIGGLEIRQDTKATTQVPLLGDVPIVGEAFKSRSTTDNRTRFYVFLRADVLRRGGFEDLKYVSGATLAEAGAPDVDAPAVEPLLIR
ncbi:MAG: secretin N-terminal domain-containing protein [Phycisphaerales bacterium]